MEEGKDKIAISCGDILTLSQELSSKEVKFAKLEMRYEMLEDENRRLKRSLDESETARKSAEAQAMYYKELWQHVTDELAMVKTQLTELVSVSRQSEREQMEKAVSLILENNVLLSILKMQLFMEKRVQDLGTAMLLRGFVEECVPDNLKSTVIGIVSKVMLLPEKSEPVPPVTNNNNRYVTMTGSDATYNENPKE